jgi:hypothetical protein
MSIPQLEDGTPSHGPFFGNEILKVLSLVHVRLLAPVSHELLWIIKSRDWGYLIDLRGRIWLSVHGIGHSSDAGQRSRRSFSNVEQCFRKARDDDAQPNYMYYRCLLLCVEKDSSHYSAYLYLLGN